MYEYVTECVSLLPINDEDESKTDCVPVVALAQNRSLFRKVHLEMTLPQIVGHVQRTDKKSEAGQLWADVMHWLARSKDSPEFDFPHPEIPSECFEN